MFSAGPVKGELVLGRQLWGERVSSTRDFKPMGREVADDDQFVIIGIDKAQPGRRPTREDIELAEA
jgi:hypothetical protein